MSVQSVQSSEDSLSSTSEALLPTLRPPQKKSKISPTFVIVGLSLLVLGVLVASTVVVIIIYARVDLESAVTLSGITAHLVALNNIAKSHNGSRSDASGGYLASIQYVEKTLQNVGQDQLVISRIPFTGTKMTILKLPAMSIVTPISLDLKLGYDFFHAFSIHSVIQSADVVVVSAPGCSSADYVDLNVTGRIAFVDGASNPGCTRRQKISTATSLGAIAVLFALNTTETPPAITRDEIKTPVPVLSFYIDHTVAVMMKKLSQGAILSVSMEFDWKYVNVSSFNLIAQTVMGSNASKIILGAHLDSTEAGPGINDNGSGSAAILEIAEQAASNGLLKRVENQVVFAWWGLEEAGLLGSVSYVDTMSRTEKESIAAVINADMIASPNFKLFVGNASSAGPNAAPGFQILQDVFVKYLNASKQPNELESLFGGSDMTPFAMAGIPVTYIGCGSGGSKTPAERDKYGGVANVPYDGCYHRSCDDIHNVANVPLGLYCEFYFLFFLFFFSPPLSSSSFFHTHTRSFNSKSNGTRFDINVER